MLRQVITRSTPTSLRPWMCRIARELNLLVLLKGVLTTLFTYDRMSMRPNISDLSVKSLYLGPLVSDRLCRSLTSISTIFFILAEVIDF